MNDFGKYLSDTEPFVIEGISVNNLYNLLQVLKDIKEPVYRKHNNHEKNDFYNWILHCVGDSRLARDIKKIRLRKNLIEIIENRIVQLEDYVRHPQNSFIEKRIDMYVDHVVFHIDNEICSNCEICSLTCPKEAVEIKDGKKTVNDDCTKCGFCVLFCPLECMSLTNNDEESSFYAENKMVPELPESKDINGTKARQLFRGSYEVIDKCPKDCEKCVEACPVNIIERFRGTKQRDKIKVDKSKCLLCGACKNACPYDIIKSSRVQIKHEGDEYCNVWNRAIEKLCRNELKNTYHNHKNLSKMRKLIDKTGMRKY